MQAQTLGQAGTRAVASVHGLQTTPAREVPGNRVCRLGLAPALERRANHQCICPCQLNVAPVVGYRHCQSDVDSSGS